MGINWMILRVQSELFGHEFLLRDYGSTNNGNGVNTLFYEISGKIGGKNMENIF